MKKLIYFFAFIALSACSNSSQKVVESSADTSVIAQEKENKNIETVIKNDSLKMIEKEKELLEKYK